MCCEIQKGYFKVKKMVLNACMKALNKQKNVEAKNNIESISREIRKEVGLR